MGPSVPATTIVSPSFNLPLTRITSIVVPMPGKAFTYENQQKLLQNFLPIILKIGLQSLQSPTLTPIIYLIQQIPLLLI